MAFTGLIAATHLLDKTENIHFQRALLGTGIGEGAIELLVISVALLILTQTISIPPIGTQEAFTAVIVVGSVAGVDIIALFIHVIYLKRKSQEDPENIDQKPVSISRLQTPEVVKPAPSAKPQYSNVIEPLKDKNLARQAEYLDAIASFQNQYPSVKFDPNLVVQPEYSHLIEPLQKLKDNEADCAAELLDSAISHVGWLLDQLKDMQYNPKQRSEEIYNHKCSTFGKTVQKIPYNKENQRELIDYIRNALDFVVVTSERNEKNKRAKAVWKDLSTLRGYVNVNVDPSKSSEKANTEVEEDSEKPDYEYLIETLEKLSGDTALYAHELLDSAMTHVDWLINKLKEVQFDPIKQRAEIRKNKQTALSNFDDELVDDRIYLKCYTWNAINFVHAASDKIGMANRAQALHKNLFILSGYVSIN